MPIEGSITTVSSPPEIKTAQPFKIPERTAPSIKGEEPVERGDQAPVRVEGETAVPPPEKAKEGETAAPPPEKVPEKKPELEAWRVAALAQKDKAIRERAAEVKKIEQQIQEREARLKEFQTQQQTRLQAYRQNPLLALKELGWDYNQLSEFVAKGGFTPEQMQALELQGIKEQMKLTQEQLVEQQRLMAEQREADLKALEDRAASEKEERAAQAVKSFEGEIQAFIETDPEKYELLNAATENSVKAIYARVEKHYEETGKVLSLQAAADLEEEMLVKEMQAFLQKSKKLRAMVTPPAPRAPARPTLSNRLTAPQGSREEVPQERETEAERRHRVAREIDAIFRRGRGETA